MAFETYSIMFGEPDEMAELAKELVSDGFGTLKVKVGQGIEKDEAVLKAIRMVRDMSLVMMITLILLMIKIHHI